MDIQDDFWRGRRVLVTGHTGFKGSWLCLWLNQLGAKVCGYSLEPPTRPSLFEQANINEVVSSLVGDIRDLEKFSDALKAHRPEVVIHMAAQSVVRAGYDDPVETYSTNVMGTVIVLHAVAQSGLECSVVNVTSDKCYQNNEWAWGYRECDRLGGRDPYSNSKACAELVASAFHDSYFSVSSDNNRVRMACARAGNVIGGGDWTPHQLIPDLMRAFLEEEPCLIRSPRSIRPWQFVLEPLRGYLLLGQALFLNQIPSGSAWNFGPDENDAKPVEWIADELVRLWGNGASWERASKEFPHEAHYLKLDNSKAKDELGSMPKMALDQALAWVVDWYRALSKGKPLSTVTDQQIQLYRSL